MQFLLSDVGGLTDVATSELDSDIQAQAKYALAQADLLIFLVDAKVDLTTEDFAIAEILRKNARPFIFVANKFENNNEATLMNLTNLGFGVPLGISALQKTYLSKFEALLAKKIRALMRTPKTSPKTPPPPPKTPPKIHLAFVGRPNVGKSALANKILGEKRFLVSAEPLTTRDAATATLTADHQIFELSDTAGLRRPGKIGRNLDRFATGRTLNALATTDVTFLVLDGSTKIMAQDLHVAEKILQVGSPLVLVINKTDLWDTPAEQKELWLRALRRRFTFIWHVPVVFVSAQTGKNLSILLEQAQKVFTAAQTKIPTPKLNQFIQRLLLTHPPARKKDLNKAPPKIFYATQIPGKTPTFTLFANRPTSFHFSWRRYLENQLRTEFGFAGSPLKLIWRERSKKET